MQYLFHPPVQPQKINNIPVFNDNPMFINDMGGHGHVLKAVGEAVKD